MTTTEFYCDAEDNNMVRCKDQCYYCLKKEIIKGLENKFDERK